MLDLAKGTLMKLASFWQESSADAYQDADTYREMGRKRMATSFQLDAQYMARRARTELFTLLETEPEGE